MIGSRYVFVVGVCALGFGGVFAISAFFLPPGNAAVPVSIAFVLISALANGVAVALKRQEDRIARLEQKLSEDRRNSV